MLSEQTDGYDCLHVSEKSLVKLKSAKDAACTNVNKIFNVLGCCPLLSPDNGFVCAWAAAWGLSNVSIMAFVFAVIQGKMKAKPF